MTRRRRRAGNKNNNASYRAMTFAAGTLQRDPDGRQRSSSSPRSARGSAADPAVAIQTVDVTNDGRFIVAKKITSLGGGISHYEFAIHNLSSDRSGRGFTVELPRGHRRSRTPASSRSRTTAASRSRAPPWTISINGNTHQLGDRALRGEPERERAPLGHDLQLLVRRDRVDRDHQDDRARSSPSRARPTRSSRRRRQLRAQHPRRRSTIRR